MEFAISASILNKKLSCFELPPATEELHLPSVQSVTRSYDSGFNSSNENIRDKQTSALKPAFALHQAILDGRLKQISYFLKMGVNPNSKDKYGRTALMVACLCDFEDYSIQVAKLLLKSGADLNLRDKRGQTVVYIACSEKRNKFFDFIMDNYSISIDYRQKDNDGNCLLNYVALCGSAKMLRQVMDQMKARKIDIDIRNLAGYSALLLAIQSDNYLNAYILLKYGQSSPSLQDNEKYFNALEWLMERIRVNKKTLCGDISRNSMYPYELSQLGYSNQREYSNKGYFKSAKPKTNYAKSLMGSVKNCNQYFNIEGSYDTIPNYSVDHHKARYVPAVLQSRYLSDIVKRDQSIPSRINTVRLEDEETEQEAIIDENTDTKELVQRLYEIIYTKMEDSYRSKHLYNVNRESESVNMPDKKNSKISNLRRSTSRSFKNSSQSNSKNEQEDLTRSMSSKSIIDNPVTYERNIFNMDRHRKTPKLMAITPAYPIDQNTKEAVHSMLSLYVATQSFCYGGEQGSAFVANESGWENNELAFETGSKSKGPSEIINKEKSTLSEKSRKKSFTSNSSRVHFN